MACVFIYKGLTFKTAEDLSEHIKKENVAPLTEAKTYKNPASIPLNQPVAFVFNSTGTQLIGNYDGTRFTITDIDKQGDPGFYKSEAGQKAKDTWETTISVDLQDINDSVDPGLKKMAIDKFSLFTVKDYTGSPAVTVPVAVTAPATVAEPEVKTEAPVVSDAETKVAALETTPEASKASLSAEEAMALAKASLLSLNEKDSNPAAFYDENARLALSEQPDVVEDFNDFKSWISTRLSIPVEKTKYLIDGRNWGRFINGAIQIYEKAGRGTGYHEAFEAVWNSYLTEVEQAELITEFRNRTGVFTNPFTNETKSYAQATPYDVREMLAEGFITYQDTQQRIANSPKTNGFFRKLLRIITDFIGLTEEEKEILDSKAGKLYQEIEEGKFFNAVPIRDNENVIDFNRSVVNSTVEFSKQVLEGMAGYFFSNLYSSDKNIESLFNNDNPELFENIYKSTFNYLQNIFNEPLTRAKATGRVVTLEDEEVLRAALRKLDPSFVYKEKVLERFFNEKEEGDIKREFKKFLSQFGLQFKNIKSAENEEEIQSIETKEESTTDTLGIRQMIYADPRSMAKSSVRLLIASLTADNYIDRNKAGNEVMTQRNSLRLPILEDYSKKINVLLNELHSIVPVFKNGQYVDTLDLMFESLDTKFKDRFNKYKPGYEWIQRLKTRLRYEKNGEKVDIATLNEDQVKLLIAFESSFTNNKNEPVKLLIGPNSSIYTVDPIVSNNVSRIKETWKNEVKVDAKTLATKNMSMAPFVYINNAGDIAFNKESNEFELISKATSTLGKIAALSRLGITFTKTPQELIESGESKEIVSAYNGIMTAFTNNVISEFDDLFGKQAVNGQINKLLNVELAATSEQTVLSHLTAAGKTQYSITLPSAASNIINSFKAVDNLNDFIRTNPQFGYVDENGEVVLNPYQAGSMVLQKGGEFFNQDGKKKKDLEYVYILGMSSSVENEGDNTDDLTYPDKIVQEMFHIMDGTYFTVINSDKSSEFGFKMGHFVKWNESIPAFENNNAIVEKYLNAVADELYAAKAEYENPSNIQYYSDKALTLGHFKEVFGFIEKEGKGVKFSPLQKDFQKVLKGKMSVEDFVNQPIVKDKIIGELRKDVEETKQWLIDLKLFKADVLENNSTVYTTKAVSSDQLLGLKTGFDTTDMSEVDFDNLVKFLVVNRQLAVYEQHKLFYGHPAFYKDLAKRANGINSQKKPVVENQSVISWMDKNKPRYDGKNRSAEFVNDQNNLTFNFISYQDPIAVSQYRNELAEGMFKSMIKDVSKKEAEKIIGATFDENGKVLTMTGGKDTTMDPYLNANEPDGGAYIMPDYFRDMMFLSSSLSKEQEDLLNYENALEVLDRTKADSGSTLFKLYTKEQIAAANEIVEKGKPDAVLQVLKPQGFGFQTTVGLAHPTMLKHSVMPLTWSRVKNNPAMLDKYIQAKENQVDIIGFESGEKVGNVLNEDGTMTPLYNEEGNSNNVLPPVQKMYNKYYGIQVEMADYGKGKVIFGSQMRKLNISNLPADLKPVAELYNSLLEDLVSIEEASLYSSLGIKKVGDTFETDDLNKLVETLKEEVQRRDLPDNIVDMINVVSSEMGDRLAYHFDASPIREKINNIINSIVDSRLLSQKMFGKAAVQVPATMFEDKSREFVYLNDKGIWTSLTDIDRATLKPAELKSVKMVSSNLKFYTENEPWMEVMLPHYFKGILPENVSLKDLDPRLLQAIGFRIPSQALNSIENIRIAGFLDPSYGDMVIVPTEIVGKSGSDFDIDKLNIFLANYKLTFNGEIKYVEFSTEDAELGNRYVAWVNKNAKSKTDETKEIKLNAKNQKNSLKEDYKNEKDIISSKYKDLKEKYKTSYQENLEIINDTADSSKNTSSILADYVTTSRRLFASLPDKFKQRFWDMHDRGERSPLSNMALAESMLSENITEKTEQTLVQMIQYYEAIQDVYNQVNEWTENEINEQKRLKEEFLNQLFDAKKSEKESASQAYKSVINKFEVELAKQVAAVNGLLSIDEFAKLPIAQQNSKEAIQNKLIETMGLLLSHKDNYRQLITPNGSATLKSLANQIRKMKGLKNNESNMTALSKWKQMSQVRESYITGKSLVGVIAVQITSHTLSQYGDVELTGRYKTGEKQPNGEPVFETINMKFDTGTAKGRYFINLIKGKDNKWISDMLSEAMTGAVDAAKDPFIFDLNLTLETATTWFYLQKLGVPVSTLAYLHNQPAVEEYFKNKSTNKSYVNKANDLEEDFDAIRFKTLDKYLIKAFGLNFSIYQMAVDAKNDVKVYTLGMDGPEWVFAKKIAYKKAKKKVNELIKKAQAEFDNYSDKELTNNIINLNTPGYVLNEKDALQQVAILSDYLDYTTQSFSFGNYVKALSYDTARTKNINENHIQKSNYKKVSDDQFITAESFNNVFERTFLSKFKQIKDSIPDMFKDFFITLDPKARPAFDKVLEVINNSDIVMNNDDKVYLMNRFENFFLNYLLHTVKIKNNGKEYSHNQFYGLFFGKDSMAKQLKRMQKKYPANEALKNLFPIISTSVNNTDNIKLFSSKLSTYEVNVLSESLKNMYEEGVITNNEELRNFATKLGIFAMLQSGVQVSPISYTKILPIELYSGVSNTVYNNFLNSAEDINPDLIWKQFHQNNAMNSVLVPLVKEYNIESSGLLKLSGLVSQSRRDYIKTSSRVSAEYNRLVAQHKATKSTLPLAEFVKQNTTPELYKTTLYERVRLFDAENNDITEKQNVVYYKPIPVVGNKMYMIEASTGDIVSKVKANAPLTDTPLITEAIEKVRNKVAAQVVEETDEESTVSEVEEGLKLAQRELLNAQPSTKTEPKGEKVKEGVYVNQEALTKDEQLELFDYLKPFLEEQASKTNKGANANKMIGLGLRWDYNSNNFGPTKMYPELGDRQPLTIGPNLAGRVTSYGYWNLSINGQPLGPISDRLKKLVTKATGIDVSDYDGAIINIYDEGTLIGNHSDLEESKSAEKYPVVAVNIGGSGNFTVGTNYKDNIKLKPGAGYLFGFNGENRKIPHSTLINKQDGFLPEITTKLDGKTYKEGSYRVTITMRRVMPLQPGMPIEPAIVSTQPSTSVRLKDGNTYTADQLNAKMLLAMGYTNQEAGKIIKNNKC